MNKKEKQQLKELLEAQRRKIAGDLDHIEKDTLNQSQRDASGDLSGYSFHMADVATDNYDREFSLDIASNEQKVLNEIEAALQKMEDGTYGKCEICDDKIKIERLKAVPYARLCVKCKQEEERKAKRKPS
ncbi:MAG TPA: TraR/DksA C4-type zinc finger protein [Candidatus Omnitrophota bacterium]|nr:TraR/DksA C4-type zinc finger protein [Candidatus Omnitrophota bacterium]